MRLESRAIAPLDDPRRQLARRVSSPVSDVIRYKNSNFTLDALIEMVVGTGQPLQITL